MKTGPVTASALTFELSRLGDDPASGFDLGDIQVTGEHGSVSSAGQRPSQSMMIYVALGALLDGLSRLSKASSASYSFLGTDSSFWLHFTLTRAGLMTIKSGRGALIAQVPRATGFASVREGVQRFLDDPENQLPRDDPVAGDLRASRRTFEAAVDAEG